jgi:2'-5' RNA ligase
MRTASDIKPDYLVRSDKPGTFLVTKWEGSDRPSAVYTITESNRGLSCNCPNSYRDKNCKHIQLVKDYIKKPSEANLKTTSKVINSAMIGLVVESTMVSKFQKELAKVMKDYNPILIEDLHVTLALLPKVETSLLDDAMKDVAAFEPEFRTLDLEVFAGRDFDYLVFKLQPDSHYKELTELLKLTLDAQVRPDSIPHVSIMKFNHGHLKEIEEKVEAIRVPSFHLVPTSVGVWNSTNIFKEARI